ncbi:MAG: OmpA family protein, partial [Oscillospiraceae bacterium]
QDEEKWEQLVKAFSRFADDPQQIVINPADQGDELAASEGEKPEGDVGNDQLNEGLPQNFEDLYSYLKKYVKENGLEDSVALSKSDNHVFIRFKDNIFFNPNSAVLKNSSYAVLKYIGEGLKNIEEKIMMVKVNGHTASVQDVNYHVSDRDLSSDRANAVLNYFEAQIQIEPSKLISTGFGKNFPIAQNDTEEGRRQNRRVELVIVSSEIGGATPQEMMSILSNNYEIEEYNEMNDIAGVIEEEAEKDIQDIGQTAETQGETTADVE